MSFLFAAIWKPKESKDMIAFVLTLGLEPTADRTAKCTQPLGLFPKRFFFGINSFLKRNKGKFVESNDCRQYVLFDPAVLATAANWRETSVDEAFLNLCHYISGRHGRAKSLDCDSIESI